MEYLLNEITFSLPYRTFIIDYSVNDKRTLPVVKEFVLRFLFTMQSCPESLISDYFGFSQEEQRDVLLELERERLIIWSNEEVKISDHAIKSFEVTDGKALPRFFEIKDELDFVDFELLSLKLITQKNTERPGFNAVEVSLPPEAVKNIKEKIKTAFDTQFMDYLEKVKRLDIFADARELYKINSVTPKSGKLLPVEVKFLLDTDNMKGPIIQFEDESVDELDDGRKIWSFINEYLQENSAPIVGHNQYLKEYLVHTKDPILTQYFQEGSIDLMSFLKAFDDGGGYFDAETRMILGNLYNPKNLGIINALLDDKYGDGNKIPAIGCLWSTYADGRFWGRSTSFTYFTNTIKKRFDNRFKPGEIVLCMSFEEEDWGQIKEIRNLFDYNHTKVHLQGMYVPFCNIQTELFLIPGVIVACLYHFNLAGFGNQTIPLGFISTNTDFLMHIQSEVRAWNENHDVFNDTFENKQVPQKDSIFNKYTSPLLKWDEFTLD